MNFRFSHRTNEYATHQPVLIEAFRKTTGPVVEFGCGHGSTPLLHQLSLESGRLVVSIESDKAWIDQFRQKYECNHHTFILTDCWSDTLRDERVTEVDWGLVFVDQNPWEARLETLLRFKDTAPYVILHDCDYFPTKGLFGEVIEPIKNPRNTGKRTYGPLFRYYKEFFPLEPWPHFSPTGPPTLLASNRYTCDWEIDFRKYGNGLSRELLIAIMRNGYHKILGRGCWAK